ncbi:putative Pilx3-4/VirB3-4 protein, putative conjugal transfer protein [Escherichia coli]|uniref:Putative Pilx3-4/VirB3-4 protein, putative conjugal transfer protein n=1 Tax=Escherichia coli TaxID=562 RepID=A0A377BH49_ECOLX|nr:putative Pilx3-4/VirB3-4 protein, putative conjugal transfer protein [Escherichia coli]
MKLKDQSSVEELIPYSSHITDNIIVTKNRDLLATWQIDGAYFECVDSEDLSILTDQLNTLIRSFEGNLLRFILIVSGVKRTSDQYLTVKFLL